VDPKPKPRRARPTAASSNSAAKRKANKVEDEAGDPAEAGPSKKKAKTDRDDDLLSRADAAELIGQVAMELEGIQGALNRTRDTLGLFTARANGKRRVTLRASS
jgi:hypothetical protein